MNVFSYRKVSEPHHGESAPGGPGAGATASVPVRCSSSPPHTAAGKARMLPWWVNVWRCSSCELLGKLLEDKLSKEQNDYSRLCLVLFLTTFVFASKSLPGKQQQRSLTLAFMLDTLCVSVSRGLGASSSPVALRATACAMPQLTITTTFYWGITIYLKSCCSCIAVCIVNSCLSSSLYVLFFCILPCSQSMLLIPGQGSSSCKFHLHAILLFTPWLRSSAATTTATVRVVAGSCQPRQVSVSVLFPCILNCWTDQFGLGQTKGSTRCLLFSSWRFLCCWCSLLYSIPDDLQCCKLQLFSAHFVISV